MCTHTTGLELTLSLLLGHEDITAWLLSQKQCNGSEKDFIGSTPVHDAADEGRVRWVYVL